MKESFFEERGIYFRMNDRKPHRPTLLFVHGLSGSSSVWIPYERELENDYNIISLDLRGHGKSKKLFFYGAYSPELIADDIIALLRHIGIAKCIVIGHSFGTLLSLAAIRQAPEKFSAAIFLSPTFGASAAWWLPLGRLFNSFFAAFSLILPFDPNPRGHVDYAKYAPTWDWSPRRIIPDIRNTSMRVYFFCARHIYNRATDAWWQDLKLPVLIVHGKRDTVIPVAQAVQLSKIIPDSKLVLLENANHILPVNNIPEVKGAITEFVDSP